MTAYEVLNDADKKAVYDKVGEDGLINQHDVIKLFVLTIVRLIILKFDFHGRRK